MFRDYEKEKYEIGLIRQAALDQNLVLNNNDHGFRTAVFKPATSKPDIFIDGPAAGRQVLGSRSVEELDKTLERPHQAYSYLGERHQTGCVVITID